MSRYPERPLGDALSRASEVVPVEPAETYETAGIYSFGRGIFRRPSIQGVQTRYKQYFRLRQRQFVFSKLFAWEGALATVSSDEEGLLVSAEFPYFDVDEKILDLRYLHHLCSWPELHDRLRDQTTGMGNRRQRVHPDRIEATTVPMPDIDEQRRIATRLDRALGWFDTLSPRRRELEVGLKASLLNRKLGNLGIERPLNDALDLELRPTVVEADHTYAISGVYSFGRGLMSKQPILGSQTKYRILYEIRADDFVLSRLKAFEGAVAVAADEFDKTYVSQEFPTFRIRQERCLPEYLRYLCSWQKFWSRLSRESKGVGSRRERVGAERLLATKVPLPDIDVQCQVVTTLALAFERLEELVRRRERLERAYQPALLNAAFNGQL